MRLKSKPELVKPAPRDPLVGPIKAAPKEGPMSYQQGFATSGSL